MPRASVHARPRGIAACPRGHSLVVGPRERELVAGPCGRAFVVALVASLALALAACRGGRTSSRAPTCADAAGQIARGMVKIRPDLTTASIDPTAEIVQLCVDDAWEPEAIRCYAGTDEPRALRTCSDRLASDQRLHAREVQELLYRRASEVGFGSPEGPTGIAACDDYVALTAAFGRCDKIPEHMKAAIAESIEQLRPAWEDLDEDSDPTAREAAELGCAAGAQALLQSMAAMGC